MAAGEETDKRYLQICDKLGFVPRELDPEPSDTEDDSKPNPFSVLELDEVRYLLDNGYLEKQK